MSKPPFRTVLICAILDRAANAGTSAAKLAKLAGLRDNTISGWRTGRTTPNPCRDEWRRFCDSIHLPPAARRDLALACGLDPAVFADLQARIAELEQALKAPR